MAPMVLYLCQHGDALAKDVDPDRPLSERGTTDVCNVAGALGGNVTVESILHSGKTRARQTAELFHERLAPEAELLVEPGLGPEDPVDVFSDQLGSSNTNVMVIGHMPFVARLASTLLRGERDVLEFVPGAVAAFNRKEDGSWLLNWMLTPALVNR